MCIFSVTFESIRQGLLVIPVSGEGQSEEGVGGIEPGSVTVRQGTKKTIFHRAKNKKKIHFP